MGDEKNKENAASYESGSVTDDVAGSGSSAAPATYLRNADVSDEHIWQDTGVKAWGSQRTRRGDSLSNRKPDALAVLGFRALKVGA